MQLVGGFRCGWAALGAQSRASGVVVALVAELSSGGVPSRVLRDVNVLALICVSSLFFFLSLDTLHFVGCFCVSPGLAILCAPVSSARTPVSTLCLGSTASTVE